MTRGRPRSAEPRIAALPADLADARLSGAACVGHAALFDAEHDDEPSPVRRARHRAAVDICERCPVLAACSTVAHELGTDAAGVWAGRVQGQRHRTRTAPPPSETASARPPPASTPAAPPRTNRPADDRSTTRWDRRPR